MTAPVATHRARPDESRQGRYAHALRQETLRSERVRAKAMAVVLTGLLAAVILTFLMLPTEYQAMLRTRLRLETPVAILVPYICFELVVIMALGWRITADRDLPKPLRYLNVLVETSLPSLILIAQMRMMEPQQALGFNAPLLYFLFIVLSTLRLDFWLSTFTGAVAAVELFFVATNFSPAAARLDLAMSPGFIGLRSIVLLVGGVLAGWVATRLRRQLYGTLAALDARDQVTRLFGQHVSPQVVDYLLAAGAREPSEARHVAVMFVDIRGFTEAASKRRPEAVVARLDALFSVLVGVIDAHKGLVNKFLGDGFLALFGAPLPEPQAAERAVAAGREMLAAIETHNHDHPDWPIEIGIAAHVGEVVTGNVGAPSRKEFTVIGDTVNLTSRIEALNKEFSTHFLVSDAVHRELGDAGGDLVALGAVMIRGYGDPVPVWRAA